MRAKAPGPLFVLLALFSIILNSVNAAGNRTIYAKESSIHYSGWGWKPYSACGRGTMFSYTIGDSFSFSFSGFALEMFFTSTPLGGVMAISVDGNQTQVDRYTPSTTYQCAQGLFNRADLTQGQHNVTVTFIGQSANSTNSTGYIDFQGYTYYFLDPGDFGYPSTAISTSTSSASSSTSSALPTTTSSRGQDQANSSGGGFTNDTASVVGVVIGGIAGLAILAVLLIILYRRSSRKDAPYNNVPGDTRGYQTTYTKAAQGGSTLGSPVTPTYQGHEEPPQPPPLPESPTTRFNQTFGARPTSTWTHRATQSTPALPSPSPYFASGLFARHLDRHPEDSPGGT